MRTKTRLGMGVLALGLTIIPAMGRAQEHRDLDLASLPSPMEALRDLQNTGRMLFVMTDVNHDGRISEKEATDAANMLVGGLFFRADADGNGTVSQEEARTVRESYLSQNPWVRYVAESLEAQRKRQPNNSNPPSPLPGLAFLIDSNNDKQIQARELRQMVQSTIQTYFAEADTNRDGQINPSEVNASVAGLVRAFAQAAFEQADADRSGQLSRNEYDKAIVEPAGVVFQILDLNHDGQLSQQETERVGRTIISQVRMLQLPEPANSPTNLIESGRLPREVAPVPNFTAPNAPQNQNRQQPGQPAPPR